MTKESKGLEIARICEQPDLEIQKVYNRRNLSNILTHPRPQRPGLALAGYPRYINRQRLQIFGKTEIGYLKQLPADQRFEQVKRFLALKIPGIIISENQPVNELLVPAGEKSRTPMMVSSLRTSLLLSRITSFLYRHFSKKIRINGVMMDILGQGIMIIGDSGIGKSETALELVNKGNRLICDDLIEFYLNANDEPVGRSIDKIKRWIEVRGLGVINIVDIFGVGALLEEKRLDLVINLEKWSSKKQYDRLGEQGQYFNVLGKDIPMFTLPVASGRNLSTLIEVAVKYFISRRSGSPSFLEHLENNGEKT